MYRKNKVCCLTGWNKHLLQLLDEGSACTLLKPHLGILFTCFQMYPSKINHCIKHEADSPDTTRKRQIRRFFLLFLRDIFPFEGMNIGKPDHPNTLMLIKKFLFFFISNQIKKKNQIISIFYVKSTNSHRRILLWKIQKENPPELGFQRGNLTLGRSDDRQNSFGALFPQEPTKSILNSSCTDL